MSTLENPSALRRLGAGALAIALATTIAACGGDKSTGSTTGSSRGTTATTPPATTTTPTTASDPASTTSTTPASDAPNGVEEKSADEIILAAKQAANARRSVHVAGDAGGTEIDVSLVRWEGAQGHFAQGSERFELIVVGGWIFMRGNDDFYRDLGGDSIRQLLVGKWMKVPAGDREYDDFDAFTDMELFMDDVLDPDAADFVKGDVETVDGIEAIAVTDPEHGTLHVATRGEPLPVKISADESTDRDPGAIVFDSWDEPVELSPPAEAIDLQELQGLRGD